MEYPASGPDHSDSELRPFHILVVDDDDLTRVVFQNSDLASRLKTTFAESEAVALEALKTTEHFDLVVIDYYLQTSVGIDLAKQIRTTWPKLRLMLLSGVPEDSPQAQEVRREGFEFLERTQNPLALPGRILEFLESSRGELRKETVAPDRPLSPSPRPVPAAPVRQNFVPTQSETLDDLVRQQSHLQSIIENSADAIFTKDLNGIILTWNPAAQRIFGFSPEDVIGNPSLPFIPIDRHAEEVSILSRIASGEMVEHVETERLAKDGRRLRVSITASPIMDLEGRIVGVSKILRHITRLPRQQDEIENSETHYRILAEERSRLLGFELQARQQNEQASRMKDQFLALLSHELRTPLNAIIGWTQLALRKVDDPTYTKRGLEIIERNARNQAQIIEDLLIMNRITAGTLKLERASFQMRPLLDEVVEGLKTRGEARAIKFKIEVAPELPEVFGDAVQVKRIVGNLLANAIKYSAKEGLVELSVTAGATDVTIRVRDFGTGIASNFLPFVFDRFTQAEGPTARRFGGLGIGLSMARHLVELHGGTITAMSDGPGTGSTFTVVLPISGGLSKSARSETSPPVERSVHDLTPLKGLRTLVVDDEPDSLSLTRAILEEQGALVLTAQSVREALQVLDRNPVDLLLSDIAMPNEDGYALVAQLQSITPNRRIPAIALTAFTRPEDRKRAFDAGFRGYVPKPIEVPALLAAIANIC
jgi:PAS domain S-box-containing protein